MRFNGINVLVYWEVERVLGEKAITVAVPSYLIVVLWRYRFLHRRTIIKLFPAVVGRLEDLNLGSCCWMLFQGFGTNTILSGWWLDLVKSQLHLQTILDKTFSSSTKLTSIPTMGTLLIRLRWHKICIWIGRCF